MAGLNKEIWINQVLEGFYPSTSWLTRSSDMSEHVENNTINLAEAGADPNVRVNNSSWPIPFAQRSDTPLALPLDTLDTENTLVRNVEEMETSYNKMESVVRGHRNALRDAQGVRASFHWAPAQDGTYTPIIPSTGATVGGFKKTKLNDIIDLGQKFNALDAPAEGRILLLSTEALAHLQTEDVALFKALLSLAGNVSGPFNLFGFTTYVYSKTPKYDSNGDIKPIGAAPAVGDVKCLAQAWVETEVMRAVGTTDLFERLNDPGERGDIVGFQQRFLALPLRNKMQAAIIQG
jgi:hypothetical protein